MFEVRVEAQFCAAHFLSNYHGKCENLHGHNYRVYAHVRGSSLDEGGMLLDFTELKRVLRDVCNSLDHSNLNEIDEFKQNPSAERIAMFIFNYLKRCVKMPVNAKLYAVDVFETETNRARYIGD